MAALSLSACHPSGQTENVDAEMDVAASDNTAADNAAARPLIFCDEVGERTTQDDCDYYRDLAERTQSGLGAFNAPDPMKRGETVTLQLVLSYAPTPAPAPATAAPAETNAAEPAPADNMEMASIDEPGGGDFKAPPEATPPPRSAPPATPLETVGDLPGKATAFVPTIGRFMRADLAGQGFTIKPLSPPRQEVVRDGETVWAWEVTALSGAAHVLTLETVVEAKGADGQWRSLKRTVKNMTIHVEVTWLGRVSDALDAAPGWLKKLAAAITALGVLLTAIFGVRAIIRNRNNAP